MSTGTPHPHLFFRTEDVETIRQKTHHALYRDDWEDLKAAVEKDLAGPPIEDGRPPRALAAAAGRVVRCAFVYRLTGEERFAEGARRTMDALLGRADEWAEQMRPDRHRTFSLRTAAVCAGLAMAYDLLAEEMSKEERERFVRTCMDRAIHVFLGDCRERRTPHLGGERTMNWLAVLASGAGLLMLALDGDGVDLSLEIEIARAHTLRFIEWYDDAGCATEHGSYWRYGMGNCVEFLAALRGNGWPDIFRQRARKLERSPYPNLYFSIAGTNVANFGDDHRAPLSARGIALILAAEYRDGRLQENANTCCPSSAAVRRPGPPWRSRPMPFDSPAYSAKIDAVNAVEDAYIVVEH